MTKSSASCCSGLEPEPLVVLVVATAVVTGGVPAVAIVRIFPGADPTGDDDPGNPAKKQSTNKLVMLNMCAVIQLHR